MQNKSKYNIICFSNQLWDFPNWTNKRLVMERMVQQGHNVLFVDPPIFPGFVLLKHLRNKNWGISRLISKVKNIGGNSIVFTPINLIPIEKVTTFFHILKIKSLIKRNSDPTKKTIIWVYHIELQGLFSYIQKLPHDILIYDCVDNYMEFPERNSVFRTTVEKTALKKQEDTLAKMANIVFTTAPSLYERMKKLNEHVYYTPNVGDYERFKNVKKLKDQLPDDIKNIPRPRIGYIGALDSYKFDWDLLKKLAQDYPSYSFVMIGPKALKDREIKVTDSEISKLENVYFLGSREYVNKGYYMAGFDVDIIPYVLNEYTVGGCFPVKFHDSLAAGLPVVVSDMPAYIPFKDVCYISKNYEEFSDNIKKALDEDTPDKAKERQKVAKENSWDNKVSNMLDIISDTFKTL